MYKCEASAVHSAYDSAMWRRIYQSKLCNLQYALRRRNDPFIPLHTLHASLKRLTVSLNYIALIILFVPLGAGNIGLGGSAMGDVARSLDGTNPMAHAARGQSGTRLMANAACASAKPSACKPNSRMIATQSYRIVSPTDDLPQDHETQQLGQSIHSTVTFGTRTGTW